MKTILSALLIFVQLASAQDPGGQREGTATVLYRDEVLHDRGAGRHLWPLLNTPDARVN